MHYYLIQAQDILNEHDIADTSSFEIGVYAGAPIILIVVAVLTSLIAFFGCCGAVKVAVGMVFFVAALSSFMIQSNGRKEIFDIIDK